MNIAIIPARGGSKRIKQKNIRNFLGREILSYSIKTVLDSESFDTVVVSTDCDEIANVAEKYGAVVAGRRPLELSDDYTGSSEVIKYELNKLCDMGWDIGIVAEVYATSPLMKTNFIDEAVRVLENSRQGIFTFGAVPFEYPVQRGFYINKNTCRALEPEAFNKRSQDLNTVYHDAGQFYIARNDTWLSADFRFDENSIPIVLPRTHVIDIDDEHDWILAENMARAIWRRL